MESAARPFGAQLKALRDAAGFTREELATIAGLSVSNSLSGGDRELDQASAVGDPTPMVEIGRGQRVSTGEGQRRVALQ